MSRGVERWSARWLSAWWPWRRRPAAGLPSGPVEWAAGFDRAVTARTEWPEERGEGYAYVGSVCQWYLCGRYRGPAFDDAALAWLCPPWHSRALETDPPARPL